MPEIIPELDLEPYLPEEFDTLSLSEVAMALKVGMQLNRLKRVNAQCPFCDGLVQAAIVGNFKRIDMVCTRCHKMYTQSFRSAMAEPSIRPQRQFETVVKRRRITGNDPRK